MNPSLMPVLISLMAGVANLFSIMLVGYILMRTKQMNKKPLIYAVLVVLLGLYIKEINFFQEWFEEYSHKDKLWNIISGPEGIMNILNMLLFYSGWYKKLDTPEFWSKKVKKD